MCFSIFFCDFFNDCVIVNNKADSHWILAVCWALFEVVYVMSMNSVHSYSTTVREVLLFPFDRLGN